MVLMKAHRNGHLSQPWVVKATEEDNIQKDF